jgi:Flp pilus assembly pilin Flp
MKGLPLHMPYGNHSKQSGRTYRGFMRNREGSTVIEFAIIAPLLFLLLVGTVETGLVLFANSVLEGATSVGSRIGKSGFTVAGQTREQYIRSKVVQLSGGIIRPNLLTVTTLSYKSFDNIGKPEPCLTASPCNGVPGVNFVDVNGNGTWDQDMGKSNAGGSGDVVLYRASYPWSLFTPLMKRIMGDSNGKITITAVAITRNEAF